MPTSPVENRAEIERLFASAPFIKDLGLKLVEIAPGACTTTLALADRHQQQDGYVHAGVLTTVADHTAGTAGASLIAAGQYVLSTDIKVCLMRAARGHRLLCRARVLKCGRRLIFTESDVFCEDERQEPIRVVKAMVTLAVVSSSS